MAVKIKARGTAKSEPKTEAKPKPRAKRSTAKSTGTKRAAKPAAKDAPKRRPGRPRKSESTTAAKPSGVTRRNRTSDIDPRTEAKLVKLVTKAGDRRRRAEEEHKESVNALHAAAQEALEAGVSMAKVAEASGISRQWLYKMGEFADRGQSLRAGAGNGSGSKPAAKSAVKRTPAAKRSPAKSTPKSSGKKSQPRARIRARS